MMDELRIEVPGIPPSANDYKRYRIVSLGHGAKPIAKWYHTAKAKAWFRDVAVFAGGRKIRGESYTLSFVVFVPDARTRDVDNFFKCILDAMAEAHGCGMIDDDKKVVEVHGYRRIDRTNPRTVAVIRTAQKELPCPDGC